LENTSLKKNFWKISLKEKSLENISLEERTFRISALRKKFWKKFGEYQP
jgi:hypothetical protein